MKQHAFNILLQKFQQKQSSKADISQCISISGTWSEPYRSSFSDVSVPGAFVWSCALCYKYQGTDGSWDTWHSTSHRHSLSRLDMYKMIRMAEMRLACTGNHYGMTMDRGHYHWTMGLIRDIQKCTHNSSIRLEDLEHCCPRLTYMIAHMSDIKFGKVFGEVFLPSAPTCVHVDLKRRSVFQQHIKELHCKTNSARHTRIRPAVQA
jgi:hypothetical protein